MRLRTLIAKGSASAPIDVLAEREFGQHAAARGIGKGAKGGVESLFNHEVEYRRPIVE
jgi:hypothetical protein